MAEATVDLNDLVAQLSESSDLVMMQYFKGLQNRTLIINGEIDGACLEMYSLPLLEWDNDGSNKEIKIVLQSVGGSVYDGLNLCDVISRLKTKTTITVFGYAYSMGAIILCAGGKNPNVTRKCYPFSTALIHSGHTSVQGTGTQVRDYNEFSDRFEKRIRDFIIDNTSISAEEYDKKSRYEWYLDSDEMLEYKLVDEII